MEQQNKLVSTSSNRTEATAPDIEHSRQHQNHRLQQNQPRLHRDIRNIAASVPFPTISSSHNDTHESLSASEPTLRFPSPVGSRYLASWITNSNPNIMRVDSQQAETSGLADSTYEMVPNVEDSEYESQDGHDHEDMSVSTSSLDPPSNSDVHSVADTEQPSEDEYTPVFVQPLDSPPVSGVNPAHIPIADFDSDSDVEEEDTGAESQSSLDYTQQILGTPSMAPKVHTPIFDLATELFVAVRDYVSGWVPESMTYLKPGEAIRTYVGGEGRDASWPDVRTLTRSQLWSIGLLILTSLSATLLSGVFIANQTSEATVGRSNNVPSALHLPMATTSTSPSWPLTTQHSGTDVKLREEGGAVERLLNFNKPHVSFTCQSQHFILAHVPLEALDMWHSDPDNCVTFRAMRDGASVESTMTHTTDGFGLRIPRREAYGDVEVILESTCKPTLRKVANLHFSQGFWEGVVEKMTHVAHDLQPVAEHGFEDFKRTLSALSPLLDKAQSYLPQGDAVNAEFRRLWTRTTLTTASNLQKLRKSAGANAASAWDCLKAGYASKKSMLRGEIDHLHHDAHELAADLADDVQVKFRVGLLNAQISAKLSWLKLLGKTEEHDEYQRKAAVHVLAKEQHFRMRSRKPAAAGRPMLPFLTKVKTDCRA